MSRRMGYGRAAGDLAADQIVARLRVAGCTHIVIDKGAGGDPRPEWHRLADSLRPGDTLVIATLPHDRPRHDRVRDQLITLAGDRSVKVVVLLGARLRLRETPVASLLPPLSPGKVGGTWHRVGAAASHPRALQPRSAGGGP